eukprot:m.71709 g.71709  ORF g.71709 m.71709 type:complete len:755 (+) comp14202_c0_seq2:3339-5603(+)
MGDFVVGKCPSEALAVTNRAIVSPGALPPGTKHVTVNCSSGTYKFTIAESPSLKPNEVGFSAAQRKWASLSLKEPIRVTAFQLPGTSFCVGSMTLQIDFLKKSTVVKERFNTDVMAKTFSGVFANQIFTVGQKFAFEFKQENIPKITFIATVEKMTPVDASSLHGKSAAAAESVAHLSQGVLLPASSVSFDVADGSGVMLAGSHKGAATKRGVISPNWNFEDMGIGGLDSEFGTMFRRAFASRVLPPEIIEKLGLKHVRGMLLFGPPGTGKTLMARQIGKMLEANEPKIVNGPEILNKYVGESEANIRKLFAEAEEEQKLKGDNSSLHIIIFDEIDAICKQRGSTSGGTGVQDSVVNQLLSKIDGVDSLNNILLIGMTNRKDLIDEALMRPGRLELQIQIGLPDEHGRHQIFIIHTKKMRDNGLLSKDVDLKDLAARTKNFSGAEIAGLVRSAVSFATNRCIKSSKTAEVDEAALSSLQVDQEDFDHALEEVVPSFGVSSAQLEECVRNGIVHWGEPVRRILTDGQLLIQQVRNSDRTPRVSALIHGASGSGTTAIASTLAMRSDFPFVKLITPNNFVGVSEVGKCGEINRVFEQAYKSPFSVIVIDDLERLLEYVPIGPRFSNVVLQCLLVLLKKQPSEGKKLLILATSASKHVLESMGLLDVFDVKLKTDTLTSGDQILTVLDDAGVFDEADMEIIRPALSNGSVLEHHADEAHINIGVKRLYMMAEMACQESTHKAEKFLSSLFNACKQRY